MAEAAPAVSKPGRRSGRPGSRASGFLVLPSGVGVSRWSNGIAVISDPLRPIQLASTPAGGVHLIGTSSWGVAPSLQHPSVVAQGVALKSPRRPTALIQGSSDAPSKTAGGACSSAKSSSSGWPRGDVEDGAEDTEAPGSSDGRRIASTRASSDVGAIDIDLVSRCGGSSASAGFDSNRCSRRYTISGFRVGARDDPCVRRVPRWRAAPSHPPFATPFIITLETVSGTKPDGIHSGTPTGRLGAQRRAPGGEHARSRPGNYPTNTVRPADPALHIGHQAGQPQTAAAVGPDPTGLALRRSRSGRGMSHLVLLRQHGDVEAPVVVRAPKPKPAGRPDLRAAAGAWAGRCGREGR